MADEQGRIEEEAAGWFVRLRDAATADWEAFTVWLEADPRHAEAYDAMALADDLADGLAPAAVPVEEEALRPRGIGRRGVIGWGIAAAIVGTVGGVRLLGGGSRHAIATGPGERREIALADGSHILLNGGGRILLDGDDPRFVRLEAGEALFTVFHDERHPFRVEAGGAELIDLGTVFNVVHDDGRIELAVAEGAVRYRGAGEEVDLDAGMRLRKEPGRPAEVGRIAPAAIGGWREGRLSFSAATYADVAAELSRNLGFAVATEGAVARRRFSGVVDIGEGPDALRGRLAALLDVDVRQVDEGWIFAARVGSPF